MTQEALSTLCTWPLALPPESVLGWLPSSPETPAGTLSHLQPLASRSCSLAGLAGRWENKGPLPVLWSCPGLPGKHSSLPPGSGLTWECHCWEHVLSTGCLSHQGKGHNRSLEPRNSLP